MSYPNFYYGDGGEAEMELFGANDFESGSEGLAFRSIGVEAQHSHLDAFDMQALKQGFDVHQTQDHFKNEAKAPAVVPKVDVAFSLPRTHFTLAHCTAQAAISRMQLSLDSAAIDMDCWFSAGECCWYGQHLSLQGTMEVVVHICQVGEGLVVSIRKLRSTCGLGVFGNIFRALQLCMCDTDSKENTDSTDNKDSTGPSKTGTISFDSPRTSASVVSADDFVLGTRVVFQLAQGLLEERIQGAQMLCDLSTKQAHYLELPAFQINCVDTLSALLSDNDVSVRTMGLMAALQFAELPSYRCRLQGQGIRDGLDSFLHPQEYQTVEARRCAISLLSLLEGEFTSRSIDRETLST
ncbi:hypothetical protein B484DRAFT_448857 [Ochromonadaceae sp. CCMP2298]|nr:hypothetical protein B484DRAFT_448857 [Ochromonadaceae sp. CCMP2298]|mmetsp:Transcript_4694/g.10553  ORF Transcript_4694/g.10553 Transcript_4694/m.10553 type:complete len:352 (+) Transcript_4694:89-1144(+)|eukprot:CAMPEP_0173200548 /NCGR_PEP_ID=MMETSP1141-20130122/17849_1 /TAXON_ID=483371 /ORGANISM="non described non described, Strain CCMP2298" /LENGTH=351 /DNA_ID=CAMNT_0014125555 /DNA_START=97 /DNA_END=1152 /DNA_ORIENTATION=-